MEFTQDDILEARLEFANRIAGIQVPHGLQVECLRLEPDRRDATKLFVALELSGIWLRGKRGCAAVSVRPAHITFAWVRGLATPHDPSLLDSLRAKLLERVDTTKNITLQPEQLVPMEVENGCIIHIKVLNTLHVHLWSLRQVLERQVRVSGLGRLEGWTGAFHIRLDAPGYVIPRPLACGWPEVCDFCRRVAAALEEGDL